MAGGHKGGLFTGLSLEERKSEALQKPFSNRPWPLNRSSTPEVHSSESLCPRLPQKALPSRPQPSTSQDHTCARAEGLPCSPSARVERVLWDVVLFWLLTSCLVGVANHMCASLCSDGAGRSGTYILIDMVLNRLAKGKDQWLRFHSFLPVFRRRPDNAEASRPLTEALGDTLRATFLRLETRRRQTKRRKIKKKKKTPSVIICSSRRIDLCRDRGVNLDSA